MWLTIYFDIDYTHYNFDEDDDIALEEFYNTLEADLKKEALKVDKIIKQKYVIKNTTIKCDL